MTRTVMLACCLWPVALASSASAAKDDLDLVTRTPAAVKGNSSSGAPMISADGRYVAFASGASNLTPDDVDTIEDVFVRDLETNTITLVSRSTAGEKGGGGSANPAISADGRYVAFHSVAANLHPDDTDDIEDVFVRDLDTNTTTLVSRAVAGEKGDGESSSPAITADGRYIAFQSVATNLHPDDTDDIEDVFIRDLKANTTALASRATGGGKGDGGSSRPAITPDGRYVAFESGAANLDDADTDATSDVFVRDMQASTTILVSRAATGEKGSDESLSPAISGDGRFVAFLSLAANLHPDDDDGTEDVFVRDLQMSTTMLASRAGGPAGAKGDDGSFDPAISADGRHVAFSSAASNLDPDDTTDVRDVLMRDLETNSTTLVSRTVGARTDATEGSFDPAVSADGRLVAFWSDAPSLHPDDADTIPDVFVRDLEVGQTALVSRSGAGTVKGNESSFAPALSADGRFIAFASRATNLHPGDPDTTFDVFVRDLQTNATTLVSRATAGAKASDDSRDPAISADGRYVAFVSMAGNLDPSDSEGVSDVFVRDLRTGTTTLVSRGLAGARPNGVSNEPAISPDGRYVAFASYASNLHEDDEDGTVDVFVRDLRAGTTTLVSRGTAGAKGNDESFTPAISADGRVVAFSSYATNLDPADQDRTVDLFVRDLRAATTRLVSRATTGAKGDGDTYDPAITADGRFVAFASFAGNLHPDDRDPDLDVFVRDLQTSTTALVSRGPGAAGADGNGDSGTPAISRDGRFVAFHSEASNLHLGDKDGTADVFVRDLPTDAITLVSRGAGATGVKGNGDSGENGGVALSADGRFVAFNSFATNLHADDTDPLSDVFRRDVLGPPPPPLTAPPPSQTPPLPPAPAPPSPLPRADRSAPVISVTGVRGRGPRCTARNFRVRVRIRDGSPLRYARLSLDGRRRLDTTRKRFRVRIRASRLRGGRHRIRVVARDLAGNRRARAVRFTRCRAAE